MRILGDDRVAVRVHRLEVGQVVLAILPEWRTRPLGTADRFLLEVDIRHVPMLERHADLANHKVAATAHPGGSFVADPDQSRVVERVACSVLEAHQVARCRILRRVGQEARLRPTYAGYPVGQPYKLP